MTGRTRITETMTAVLMAGVMAGYSVQTENQATPTVEKQQAKGTVQETEPQKSTYPEPSQAQPFPGVEKEVKTEPLIRERRIILMISIHYLAESLTDRGDVSQAIIKYNNGKLINYVWKITGATLEEIKLPSPDVLVISGDLSPQGGKKNHEEPAKRLDEVEKAGVTVLVIPGNHDISNPSASVYLGGGRYLVEPATPEDFERIYREFGYSEASGRDANSLSYTYNLGPSMRLLVPDTCQYGPRNEVGGVIGTEIYKWIGEQLEQTVQDNVILLSVAHRNLLEESRAYVDNCTIEHSKELIQMLERENIPLFLNGHLRVQHFMRNNDIGIYKMITSSPSTPPCQYGVLDYMENEAFYYCTRRVNMEKWARKNKNTGKSLLDFDTYNPPILKQVFYNQAYDAMKNSAEEETGSISVELIGSKKQQMVKAYGDVNAACYGGRVYEVVEEAVKQPGYSMWKEYHYPNILHEYLEYIVRDAVRDYNVLNIE